MNPGEKSLGKPERGVGLSRFIHAKVCRETRCVGSLGHATIEEEDQRSIADRTYGSAHGLQDGVDGRLRYRVTPCEVAAKSVFSVGLQGG